MGTGHPPVRHDQVVGFDEQFDREIHVGERGKYLPPPLQLVSTNVGAEGCRVDPVGDVTHEIGRPELEHGLLVTFRVPNELVDANTVKVVLQLPQDHPIADVEVLAMPGWSDTIQMKHLTTPIKTDDGSFSDVASVITWTGGKIAPGQYGEFKILAMGLPTDTDQLVFKALQTYDNGSTTSWIETQADAENPAPVINLTAEVPEDGAAPATTLVAANSGSSQPVAATTAKASSSSNGLAIVGIIVGTVGLITAVIALVLAMGRQVASERQ